MCIKWYFLVQISHKGGTESIINLHLHFKGQTFMFQRLVFDKNISTVDS